MGKKSEWWWRPDKEPNCAAEIAKDFHRYCKQIIKEAQENAIAGYELEAKEEALTRELVKAKNDKNEEQIERYANAKKDLEKQKEDILYHVEAVILNEFNKAFKSGSEYLERNHGPQLRHARRERFPLGWMKDGGKIEANIIDKYSYFSAIMNFIDKLTRYLKVEEYDKMVALYKTATDGRKYLHPDSKEEYQFSSFLVNRSFKDRISKELGCSISTIEKYIKAFCKAGILKMFGQRGSRGGVLYSDGYYVEKSSWRHKVNFVIDTKKYRKALREFNFK